jgi:hypothetical protein
MSRQRNKLQKVVNLPDNPEKGHRGTRCSTRKLLTRGDSWPVAEETLLRESDELAEVAQNPRWLLTVKG